VTVPCPRLCLLACTLLVGGVLLYGQNTSNQSSQNKPVVRTTAPPEVKFKDLEAVVNAKDRYNLVPFDVRVDFLKATADTVLVPITLQISNRELTYIAKDGVQRAVVNIFGRLTTPEGTVAGTFEEAGHLDIPTELLSKVLGNVAVYQKALLVRPGRYRLDIVLKDVNGNKLGTFAQSLMVPDFSDDKLASSTLILADVMEKAAPRDLAAENFVLGVYRVRPRVASAGGKPATFKHDQKISFWLQVYNLAPKPKAGQPSATFEYQVVNTATNKTVVDVTETSDQMDNVGNQLTLTTSLLARKLEPGVYQVTITVKDLASKQVISPTVQFAVE
jgi:hypothetical protein